MGPGVVVDENVVIGAGCKLGAYSIFTGPALIGPDNVFGSHVVIGADPQDKKFSGGGLLTIGSGNVFREFVTIHRGHLSETGTVIGNGNWFLCGAHAGHDCKIGDDNFFSNNVLLAGHVEIGNKVNLSGYVGLHQFCRVGDLAMISGHSGVRGDIYPYSLVHGDPAVHLGINKVGLEREGWSVEQRTAMKEAFRLLRAHAGEGGGEYLERLIEFGEHSKRGMAKFGRSMAT